MAFPNVIDDRGQMATRVELREISNEEGNRLLRIVRRDSGSVVTWRRAQVVLLSAQGILYSGGPIRLSLPPANC